jgi:hypothetical protein
MRVRPAPQPTATCVITLSDSGSAIGAGVMACADARIEKKKYCDGNQSDQLYFSIDRCLRSTSHGQE